MSTVAAAADKLLPVTARRIDESPSETSSLQILTHRPALPNAQSPASFRSPATRRFRRVALTLLLTPQANHVLPQEVERDGEQNDVLHQEGHVTRHRREASRGDVPALRHERNDGDRRDEGASRAEGAKSAEPLVREACEQQGPERPLRDAQEIAGAGVAKDRIQPPDQRPVAVMQD